jgi:hypothetical protein
MMAGAWNRFLTSLLPAESAESPGASSRQATYLALAILGVYLVLAWISRLPGVGIGNDDAMYVFLAKSLLQGSYREIFRPEAPPHIQYPPGFPALLAILLPLVGDRSAVLMLIPLSLSAGGLWLLFLTARRILPAFAAVAVLLIAASNPLLITYGGRLKAEAAFFFFTMLTLWAFTGSEPTRRRLMIGCAAAIASAFMRSVGIAVIAAVLIHFVLERRWRWAIGFGLVAAATFGPWLAWSFLGPRQVVGRSYAGDLMQVQADGARHSDRHPLVTLVLGAVLRARVYLLGHLHATMGFAQTAGTLADNLGWVAIFGATSSAGSLALWRRSRITVLTAVMILGVLSVWAWADRRFLHPVAPLVGLLMIAGAVVIGRRLGRYGPLVAVMVVLVSLAPGTIERASTVVARGWACDPNRPVETCYNPVEAAFLAGSLAARSLPDTAIALVEREATFAFHSGKRGRYAREDSDAQAASFLNFIRVHRITHALTTRVTREEAIGLEGRLDAICDRVELLGDFGQGTLLFAIHPDPRPDQPFEPACPATAKMLEEARRLRAERLRNPELFEIPDDDDQRAP